MYINHNGMASNVANTLTSHYSNLATSTQRLSSGLRVNSAADDAAGLAIRELMRADISSLQQGVRNANDAISLIQTADGALGIIDEKLIRMKELAEQAATGTYDSTQRLMIESEYQAMASEITRIANATDFNGMKLLDGSLEGTHDGSGLTATGEMKIHFGTGNDSAEDYYYIRIDEMTAQALGVGNASTWQDVQARAADALEKNLTDAIKNNENLSATDKAQLLSEVQGVVDNYNQAISAVVNDPAKAYAAWSASDTVDAAAGTTDDGFLAAGKVGIQGNSTLMNDFLAAGARANSTITATDSEVQSIVAAVEKAAADKWAEYDPATIDWENDSANTTRAVDADDVRDAIIDAARKAASAAGITDATVLTGIGTDVTTAWTALSGTKAGGPPSDVTAAGLTAFNADDSTNNSLAKAIKDTVEPEAIKVVQAEADKALDTFWGGLRDTEKQKLQYAFGQAAAYNLANAPAATTTANYGIGANAFTFGGTLTGTAATEAASMLTNALQAGQTRIKDMNFAGFTIETQEDAQQALTALNDAIVQKDKTRAHLGALQNRLENTVSNLTIQAENLQAAESRISDVDVATEMTNFVRNQILTQSAVAMLGQANSMPQMAMQLIG